MILYFSTDDDICTYIFTERKYTLIRLVVRSKALVCGRSLAGIVGSNPVGDMVVCLL